MLAEIHRRETDINGLKAMIRDLESQQRQRDHEEGERAHPKLDELHAEIFTLQEKMRVYQLDYQSRIMRDRQKTENVIGHIQSKVWTLEQENTYAASLLAPVRRLPVELLSEIFTVAIVVYDCPSFRLMRVCRLWRWVLMAMRWVWSIVKVRTWTRADFIEFLLERTQGVTLDVEIDTDSDAELYSSDPSRPYAALAMVVKIPQRWRNLTIRSFPPEIDLMNSEAFRSALEFDGPGPRALGILTSAMANSELTTVEINSETVISFLAPAYSSIFRSVKILSLNMQRMSNPVDLLPHLYQLESFNASHITFPIYHNDVDLPFVRSLRHLRLRAVSIQWMSGRTFHALEDCTIIFPLHLHVLHTFNTALPNCTHLSFHGYPLKILGGVLACKLTQLSVICPASFNRRGSRQLVSLSWQVLGESRLRPKSLHISVEAVNQAWLFALAFMSNLEELVIYNARPSSLGSKFFQSLIVQPGYASNLGGPSTPGRLCGPLCPSLRRFGLKYDRWLRPGERFPLIPDFASVIRSRECPIYSLQSFSVWMTSNQKVALELIEQSQMSVKGFEGLAKESGIEGYSFKFTDGAFNVIYPAIEARPAVVRPRSSQLSPRM